MAKYCTDTQALVYFLQGKKVINEKMHTLFREADNGAHVIVIPSIVVMEVMYLCEKNRVPVNILNIEVLLASKNYAYEPLTIDILKTASTIKDIPELHDRLIAATACYLDIPLITNDPELLRSAFVKKPG